LTSEDERYELVVEQEELPDNGAHSNAVCRVTVIDEGLAEVEYLPEETENQTEDAQNRFDRLSRRLPEEEQ
jgi:hypothetical protein